MDENSRKRKREEEGGSDVEGVESETPLEGTKRATKKAKKQKLGGEKVNAIKRSEQTEEGTNQVEVDANAVQKATAEMKRLKRERKQKKQDAKEAKKEAKKAKKEPQEKVEVADRESNHDEDDDASPFAGDIDPVEMEDIAAPSHDSAPSTATPSPFPDSPAFDAPPTESESSSISSIVPPIASSAPRKEKSNTDAPLSKSFKESEPPKAAPGELRSRLQTRIEELRAARRADGPNGKPARNRQELLDARRQKEEQRKAHKKSLRRQAKEEEERQKAETLARGSPLLSPASFNARGSPLMSPGTGSNATTPGEATNNFSFGRIAFGQGQEASAHLNDVMNIKDPKGPSDPRTALQAAAKKQAHLASLDPATRAEREEKDMWLNARKHAHGERVRDDTSLLKKTLKRKEKQKAKSTKEWSERLEGIKYAQSLKQKRREDNLAKRKEEKGVKKGNGKKKEKAKRKPRPGFEGGFGARAPSSSGKKK